jgi:hypothetical protein
MAGRSQLPVQIMENQARFDLNAAIENWRNELAAQPNLASDDRRELETHLCDAIAGFQQRGLNDEESFWLARRRVGQPQQIGEEFVKADPAKVWRERLFWMVLVLFLIDTLSTIPRFIGALIVPAGPAENLSAEILVALLYFSPLITAVLLGAGKMTRPFSKLTRLIDGRFRMASAAFILILTSSVLRYFTQILFYLKVEAMNANISLDQNFHPIPISQLLIEAIPLFILALLLIWLMPTQNRKTPKRA